uniref:hypothetical protein n=1 Tax=Mediterraneibacter glycyrrhizinilyticus TaxID=342942 RepID=UPI000A3DD086
MHVKAKKIAFGGMLLALTIIFMMLGSIIETGTLFLLAAASFFVGIIWREFGAGSGVAFWGAACFSDCLLHRISFTSSLMR